MAHSRPWYKRNPSDFVMGTLAFDLETRGAYSLIIDLLNHEDRPLVDDPRGIAGILKCSTRRWIKIRQTLLDAGKLILVGDGYISNPRFERERQERIEEHERSVEAGRIGGLKSAARRAEQQSETQGELEINGETLPKLSPNFAQTLEKNVETEEQKPQKTATEVQPPPQPSRARQSPESRDTDNHPVTPPHARAREGPEALDRLDDRDLHSLFEACCSAAGFNPITPTHIDAQLKIIETWRKAGISFETVVLPTIRSTVANTSDPTGSLRRFDKQVRHEHARQGANVAAGARYRPPPEPIYHLEGESPRVEPFRRALAKRMGIGVYSAIVNDRVRFEVVEDRNAIKVNNQSNVRIDDGANFHHLRAAAKESGFTDVW